VDKLSCRGQLGEVIYEDVGVEKKSHRLGSPACAVLGSLLGKITFQVIAVHSTERTAARLKGTTQPLRVVSRPDVCLLKWIVAIHNVFFHFGYLVANAALFEFNRSDIGRPKQPLKLTAWLHVDGSSIRRRSFFILHGINIISRKTAQFPRSQRRRDLRRALSTKITHQLTLYGLLAKWPWTCSGWKTISTRWLGSRASV